VDYVRPLVLDEEFTISASLIWNEGARLNTEYELTKADGPLRRAGTRAGLQRRRERPGVPRDAADAWNAAGSVGRPASSRTCSHEGSCRRAGPGDGMGRWSQCLLARHTERQAGILPRERFNTQAFQAHIAALVSGLDAGAADSLVMQMLKPLLAPLAGRLPDGTL